MSVDLQLSSDEAIVLFETLSRLCEEDNFEFLHQGEFQALCNLQCLLEKSLSEPFESDYQSRLEQALLRLNIPK